MNIILENIGRRFNRDWIFRNVTYTFTTGNSYAILGPNGSGKSTLLQLIAGSLTPSAGSVSYQQNNTKLDIETAYAHISMAAPYIELIEEFNLQEQIEFHFKFKKYRSGMDSAAVIALSGLEQSKNKTIRNFSSGMKQRTRLVLALCADTPVILLDEPTSNLDANGISWYQDLVQRMTKDSLLIIGSNQEHEYFFCKNLLTVTDFK